ncbi:zinc finger HIT domain-containing protein 2 [Ixodes scapularis]|uniref:zinc finger HIT domain-containing protein 2 n=1 Tax=Ixodes scapularis TaxID=6945 RepID=UPI001C37EAB1|nr:zinc finger HIT domain-containing protein 2 [Ixodes scapularis]
MENPESRQCKFCELPSAKYTCPRCGFAYCSSACYKDARHHNCSEDFYKDWVHTYLRTEQADPEARRNMMDVLASAHREEEGEQGEQEELVERLAEVDLDDAESAWSCLTEEEKAEFEELVASGSAGKLVPVWQPWWERAPLIAEVAPTDAISDVPPLSRLTSQPPAPCVVNSALNVLCGYVYVARLYNGDLLPESALELLSVSAILSEDAVFASASEAVQSSLQRTLTLREQTTAQEFPAVLASFRKLLEGAGLGDNVMRALEEVRALLQGAAESGHLEREVRRKLRHAVKKAEYLVAWAREHGRELLSCLPDVDAEALAVAENVALFKRAAETVVRKAPASDVGSRPLIEELN